MAALPDRRDPVPAPLPPNRPPPALTPREEFAAALRSTVAQFGNTCSRGWASLDPKRRLVVTSSTLAAIAVLAVSIGGLSSQPSDHSGSQNTANDAPRKGVQAVPNCTTPAPAVAVQPEKPHQPESVAAGSEADSPAQNSRHADHHSRNHVAANGEPNASAVSPTNHQPQRYAVTELGMLGGKTTEAVGINNAGQVVGYSGTKSGDYLGHAFIWEARVGMRDLGTLGGEYSRAKCTNNKGQVVGSAGTSVKRLGLERSHEFIWDRRHGMRDLNKILGDPEDDRIDVRAINDKGQTVGRRRIRIVPSADDPSGGHDKEECSGFLWQPDGSVQELGNIAPIGINGSGEVAGKRH